MPLTVEDVLARNGIKDTSLTHYGVPGMKWGKRRSNKQLAEAAEKRAKLDSMSDDELKAKINRLKLEKEYTQLTSPQVAKGKNEVVKLLADVGKQQARNYLNKQGEKMINELMDSSRKGASKQLALTR